MTKKNADTVIHKARSLFLPTLLLIIFSLSILSFVLFKETQKLSYLLTTSRDFSTNHPITQSNHTTSSLSSTLLTSPDGANNVRLFLYSPNQKVYIVPPDGLSCIAPDMGLKIYSGKYDLVLDPLTSQFNKFKGNKINWKDSKLSLGPLEFAENTAWDGNLNVVYVTDDYTHPALIINQPAGCNFMLSHVYGFDFKKHQLFQYKFKHLNGNLVDFVTTDTALMTKSKLLNNFESRYYSNGDGKVHHSIWQFDGENGFIETSYWTPNL